MHHVQFRTVLASLICNLLELEPRLHIIEALEKVFLPILPSFVPYTTRQDLEQVQRAFTRGPVLAKDVTGAAWLLLIDSALWMAHAFKKPEESLFIELANITRTSQEVRLKFAHCIRDLAYGKEQRVDDLVAMVKNPDAGMRRLMVDILWINSKKTPVN